jgi:hypothetical protein
MDTAVWLAGGWSQRLPDLPGCILWVLMLPDAYDGPTGVREPSVHLSVTLDVPVELWSPVPAVGTRGGAVLRASMPEASIDEDGHSSSRKHDVGADRSPGVGPDGEVLAEAQP